LPPATTALSALHAANGRLISNAIDGSNTTTDRCLPIS
jgi:hypothetical protein